VVVRREANKGREQGESGESLASCGTGGRCGYWDGDEEVVPRGGVDEFEKLACGGALSGCWRRRSGVGRGRAVVAERDYT